MAVGVKRKRTEGEPAAESQSNTESQTAAESRPNTTTKNKIPRSSLSTTRDITTTKTPLPTEMSPQLLRISLSKRTPFEKRVWSLLCQIPPGRVSTYGLMAAHLGSSPRAVGNALRRNPFAPEVPCHRVVATGGALGGFKGHWAREGEGITAGEKVRLLRGEGVRVDPKGRVLGTPWSGFKQ